MHKKIAAVLALSFIVAPFAVEARHNSGSYGSGSYSGGVNRSSLDEDIVEKFPTPVLFYVNMSKIASDFGDPRGDGTHTHEGQDMLAPQGTPVVTPTDAIVIRTGNGESACGSWSNWLLRAGAITAFQQKNTVALSGVYDSDTREVMTKTEVVLNLK